MGTRPWGTSLLGSWSHATRNELVELSPIKAVELEASRIPDVVSLAQGIPSFDTPEPIKRFAAERMAEGACARYSVSPGLPVLREAIAEALTRDGMSYDPDREILVVNR
jgi:aminotransferase